MKISKINAIALFTALGFQTASKWDEARLLKKLTELPEQVDGETKLEDENVQKLLDGVIKAKGKVELVDEPAENSPSKKEEDEEAAPAKKSDKASKKPAPAKEEDEEAPAPKQDAKKSAPAKGAEAPAKKAAPEVDKFGCRVNSQAGAIDAVLSKKWQTLEEIAKDTKLGVPRVKAHVRFLANKKLVEFTDKGVRVV